MFKNIFPLTAVVYILGNSLSAILDGEARLTFLNRGEDYVMNMPYAHCKGQPDHSHVLISLLKCSYEAVYAPHEPFDPPLTRFPHVRFRACRTQSRLMQRSTTCSVEHMQWKGGHQKNMCQTYSLSNESVSKISRTRPKSRVHFLSQSPVLTETSRALGILYGTMTLELGGQITIACEKTGYSAQLEFKLKVWLRFLV